MAKYIKLFEQHLDYESYINSGDAILPNVSYCKDETDMVHYNPYVAPDYSKEYFTIEIVSAGTITIKANNANVAKTISYSTDDGSTWAELATSTTEQSFGTFSAGDKIMLKGTNTTYGTSSYYNSFGGTAKYNIYGNIMSLLYGDSFIDQTDLPSGSTYTFNSLFYQSTGLIDASNLILPATTLVYSCYYHMFSGCTSLKTAPELPATTLAYGCYMGMFTGCTSLKTAPELPATTLENQCYNGMFGGCTSLTTAPSILPATTLASSCYQTMFYDCSGLTTAPELPATTLASSCYNYMFYRCTRLNYIKAMFTTTPSTTYTNSWVSGVASTGTFVKNASATWTTTGNNGIPNGWTVQTASA